MECQTSVQLMPVARNKRKDSPFPPHQRHESFDEFREAGETIVLKPDRLRENISTGMDRAFNEKYASNKTVKFEDTFCRFSSRDKFWPLDTKMKHGARRTHAKERSLLGIP